VRRSWPVIAVLVLAGAACSGSSGPTATAHRSATTTTLPATTTTTAGILPCGGAFTLPAAVKVSPVAGLNQNPDLYQVQNVTIARSDPNWARFDTLPVPGQEGNYQGGSGLAHCAESSWTVSDFGSAGVGCPGGTVTPPPSAVAGDLGISCP
jgi:hypothetical protein